ncbi:IS66 family transposase [Sodalinema gerasimenkoae]|uniref:IS66 family transposase n=1 Tax=Sodalinema gerasimenkoae TaxID=2862348 RepID=UPI001359681B|nr:transposase [Sodalinema gerasimenkoae]
MEINLPAIPKYPEAFHQLSKLELVALVLHQQALLEQLLGQVERLKRLIDKGAQTSSKPSLSDLIRRSEKAQGDKESAQEDSRKPLVQLGHRGTTRKGFGRGNPYEVLEPRRCPVSGGQHFQDKEYSRVTEVVAQLVERPVEIVEYQQVRRVCGDCGETVSGEFLDRMIPGQDLGDRLQGILAWIGHYGNLSYGKQQEWFEEFTQIRVGIRTLEATSRRVAPANLGTLEALSKWFRHQPSTHVDESPELVGGMKEWLWTVSGEGYRLLHPGDTRSRRKLELEQLLGQKFAGVLSSDDFSVYNGYQASTQGYSTLIKALIKNT